MSVEGAAIHIGGDAHRGRDEAEQEPGQRGRTALQALRMSRSEQLSSR